MDPESSKTSLKVQPKNATRRSQEERAAIERTEAQKRNARARAAEADQAAQLASTRAKYGTPGRGAFRSPRRGGRGGFMGQNDRPFEREVSGPPPDAPQGPKHPGGRSRGLKRGRGRYAGSRKGKEPAVKEEEDGDAVTSEVQTLPPVKKDTGQIDIVDSDDEYPNSRINIESINLSSDEEDRFDLPVRLKRTEHRDREIGLNTEASALTAAGAKKRSHLSNNNSVIDISDEESGSPEREKGKQKAVKAKVEDADDTALPSSSPTTRRRVHFVSSDDDDDDDIRGQGKANSTKSQAWRRKQRLAQTEEEQRELDILEKEANIMHVELSDVAPLSQQNRGESAQGEVKKLAKTMRDDAIYLFQLPPVIPELKMPDDQPPKQDTPAQPSPKKKRKSEDIDDGDDKSKVEIIKDEDPLDAMKRKSAAESNMPKVASGRVGKLRIHKSGRATLDWGSVPMELGMGTDTSFLQNVVLADMHKGQTHDGIHQGTAMCLGSVRGKFVVTPNVDEMLVS